MSSYTDVFGNLTIPPAQYGYQALTFSVSAAAQWPYNYTGTGVVISKIIDITPGAGLTLTAPDATQVSTGEDFLIRNVGANSVTLADNGGTPIATILAGAASYFYVTSNATAAGTWGTIAYGAGSATISAAALVGYGISAIGSSLNQSHPVSAIAGNLVIDVTYRAALLNATGGSATWSLPAVATAGNNFFFLIHNSGNGTVTLTPNGVETIDAAASLTIQPGESAFILCSGTAWLSVGYGRSTVYQFNQLVLDVSGGGTFTLTSGQASNKLLTFTGNPAADVTIVVPNTVSVYYVLNSLSTNHNLNITTLAGTGTSVGQSQRIITLCDSVNVYPAQTATVGTNVSLIDGTAAAPSLNFASKTNTGFYKAGANGFGFAVSGVSVLTHDGTTLTIPGIIASATWNGATVGAAYGGTGIASYAVGDILYASGATALSKLADVATGSALISGGLTTAPAWGKIGLSTHVSGILPTANGGTGMAFFAVSGPTVARTFAFPDASATVLTSNAAVTVAQGGTGVATLAAHGLVVGNGASAVNVTGAGTSGQVLTSNGAGADPTFQPAQGNGLTLLASLTPTAAATVDALSTFTSTYDNYLIIGEGILPAADDVLLMRYANGGVVDTGSNYYTGGTAGSAFTASATSISVTVANVISAGKGTGFVIEIQNANDAVNIKTQRTHYVREGVATPSFTFDQRGSAYIVASAVSGVRFFWTGANNFSATGKIKIYGYTN